MRDRISQNDRNRDEPQHQRHETVHRQEGEQRFRRIILRLRIETGPGKNRQRDADAERLENLPHHAEKGEEESRSRLAAFESIEIDDIRHDRRAENGGSSESETLDQRYEKHAPYHGFGRDGLHYIDHQRN